MENNKVNITVDGREYNVPAGTTILEACREIGIKIPSLCYMKDVSHNASCAMCVVEVKGAKNLVRSCISMVAEGMDIKTHSPLVDQARKINLELILANHPKDCLICERNGNCELQDLTSIIGIKETPFLKTKTAAKVDDTSLSLLRTPEKCILCGRCVAVCADVQTVHAIDFSGRGLKTKVSTYLDKGLGNVACTNCGQCALVCPTAAITERDESRNVFNEIYNKDKFVVVQTAPAIRVGIGEAMGMEYGALVTGKMVAGLRRVGFDKVFDTQFAADLTIMEEGYELIERIKNKGVLPMVTSCSPGWIKFIEHFFPKCLDHLSTCKSPQQMFGAVAKTYYAEKLNIDPRKIVVVSIMPCTAKKFECKRPEMKSAFKYWKDKINLKENEEFFDVDYVLTTRELARMFKQSGIDFKNLPEEEFDEPLGISSGAGVIFGATGGVMEAAVRTAYEVLTSKPLPNIDLKAVRGFEGIKEAELDINGMKLKVAVVHTLKNARTLLDQIEEGKSPYAFIEVMTCPGGCLGGGGQSIPTTWEIRQKRADSIYREDSLKPIRKSHENPAIKTIYEEFLEKPLGHHSHELLHTSYIERGIY
jgi:iron-only hydrogenase group A